MAARAFESFVDHLGPLQTLIADASIQEIMVNAPGDVWIERGGIMQRADGVDVDDYRIRAAVRSLAAANERDAQLVLDARLPGYRIAVALPPVSVRGGTLCIRKHARSARTLQDYVASTELSERAEQDQGDLDRYLSAHREAIARGGAALVDFLAWCVHQHKNFIVAGATGSGKTTFMNAMLTAVPSHERVVTIEDTAELKIALPNYVSLEAYEQEQIDIRRLVRLALRLRPDRIVVGEVRGSEAYDLIDAMNTGHPGGGCTLHADSALFALYRIESLVRMSPAAVNIPLAALRQLIAQTFHVIVYCERRGALRRPVQVAVVRGVQNLEYQIDDVYRC
ncbi:MAG: ATPase, T2SS/T4P/T4SS family [Rhodocyclaceae bacterium]|nr:ATPase, T2SS/T4P/T4SS family [Rhodocyclaceae bacterium]